MRLSNLPVQAAATLRQGLDLYQRATGPSALRQAGIEPQEVYAKGAIREAYVNVGDHERFLEAEGAEFDRFFDRYRVFLFAQDEPIGSVCLHEKDDGDYSIEYVALDRQAAPERSDAPPTESDRPRDIGTATSELMEAWEILKGVSAGDDRELRLVLFPKLYVAVLVLVGGAGPRVYQVIGRPKRSVDLDDDWVHATATAPHPATAVQPKHDDFAEFLEAAVAHHRSVFGEEE